MKFQYQHKKAVLIALLLCSIGLLGVSIVLYQPGLEIIKLPKITLGREQRSYAEDVLGIDFTQPTPAPLNKTSSPKFIQTGWIPDWDINDGIDSLSTARGKFDSISPVWYYLNKDGSVHASRVGLSQLKQLRSQYGIKIIPSIASFSSADFHKILGNPKKLDEHIAFFKNEVAKYDLDGIDLDYESMRIEDKPAYLKLIRELYTYLNERGKKLTIAVIPRFSHNMPWRSFVQTREVQSWQTISRYVHEIRIMTYNLTGGNSKYPGPVGPLDWIEANLRYARTQIAAEKIIIGVHHYAYGGWSGNPTINDPYLSPFENSWLKNIQASALEYEGIKLRQLSTISDKYDKQLGESILRYRKDGKTNIAYYIDARGVAARKDLVKRYGAKGVAYWRLGDEDTSGY